MNLAGLISLLGRESRLDMQTTISQKFSVIHVFMLILALVLSVWAGAATSAPTQTPSPTV